MLTNMEIITQNLELINRCVDCQFSKSKREFQFKEDFKNDLIIILNDYDNEKLNEIYEQGHLNAFITAIIRKNLYSSSSNFYRTYYLFQKRMDNIAQIIQQEDEDDEDNDA